MRILQLVQKPQLRGAEMFASQLAQWLSNQGHVVRSVYLYPYSGPAGLPLRAEDRVLDGREQHPLETCPGWHLGLLLALLGAIRRFDPDVVQVNGARTVKYGALARSYHRGGHWCLVYRNTGTPRVWHPLSAAPVVGTVAVFRPQKNLHDWLTAAQWLKARGHSLCLVAEEEGALVGLRVFMYWAWRTDGRELAAVRAVDTATHPKQRGRGVFSRLTLAVLEQVRAQGVSFVFNTPDRYSRPGYLRVGWQEVTKVPVFVRPLHSLRCFYTVMVPRRRVDGSPCSVHPLPMVNDLLSHPRLESFLTRLCAGATYGGLRRIDPCRAMPSFL